MSAQSVVFAEFKKNATAHGLLAGISFTIVLPAGVIAARYLRTFTNRWWHVHWIVNLFIGCPLILAAWAMGKEAHNVINAPETTPHGKRGVIIIGLYIAQVVLGLLIHYVRIPARFIGNWHRPPQNFIHAVLGLAILAMANFQVHEGLYQKSAFLDADVRQFAKRAWLGLIIVFWCMYAIGLVFLPRQYTQERRSKLQKEQEGYKLKDDLHRRDKFAEL